MSDEHVVARIVDANFNRAREAFRVMEEFGRFVLNDEALTGQIKSGRHELAACVRELPGGLMLRHREIEADVGRAVQTEAEYQRSGALDVALAAGKRLSEALRSIEEYGKTFDGAWARRIEQLRYRGYAIERRIGCIAEARARFAGVKLYVLITESCCHGDWFATAEAALRGGAGCLQLREKGLSDRSLIDRGKRLSALCHDHGALFFVNDRPDIATATDADGVHVGQDDMTVAQARRVLPLHAMVGLSTHSEEQVESAVEDMPDCVAVGPMFPSKTKPQAVVPGPALVTFACRATSLPIIAIGGITADNAGDVLSAGPAVLCVCEAVTGQVEVEASAFAICGAMDRANRT